MSWADIVVESEPDSTNKSSLINILSMGDMKWRRRRKIKESSCPKYVLNALHTIAECAPLKIRSLAVNSMSCEKRGVPGKNHDFVH